ncbi:amino acid adenylation domain-containing protein, partial [Acidobacteriota bacterium]
NHKTATEYGITAGQSLEEREYWLKKLRGEWTKSRFHYDYKKVKGREYKPDAVKFNLPDELFIRLMEITSGSDSKFHMILLTQLVLLLGKYTGSRDIIVGSPIYRQKVKGEFINTVLPLRNQLKKDMTFKALLLQVRETIKEAVKNQNYPMDELIYDLDLPVSDDPFPLFDIALLLENIHDREYIAQIPLSMTFSFSRTGDALEGTVVYDSLLYEKTSIQHIVNHFCNLAGKTLFDVDLPMSAVNVFSEEEKKQLLVDFNNTGANYPLDKTIHELFAGQAEMWPGNTALVIWGERETTGPVRRQLTYAELNKKANRLARRLREKGVKPGTIVSLLVESSIEMIVGVLGILKAGGAYLPIDTDTPPQRIQTVLEDSAVGFLVTQKQLSDKINFVKEIMDLEDETLSTSTRGEASNPGNITTSADLAYVIYTSGSTGIPKGVMIEHRNLLNYVFWRLGAYKQTSEDGCLQILSVAFDGFCANLYPAVLSGGKVVMLTNNRLRDIDYIGKVIKEEKVTTFSLTPLLYKAIVERVKQEDLKSVKFVIIGGERASKDIIELSYKIAPHITLINEYGPTENSVTTTANIGITPGNVSIVGKPISNNYIYILDENRELKPVGVPGELCVTGSGVARGYLNSPELTSEKFDHDLWDYQDDQDEYNKKFLPGVSGCFTGAVFSKRVPPGGRRRQKIYRTGDIARWLPDSSANIELVGRLDDQLKIRGYRIELGEIETYLSGFHSIKEAVVIVGGEETADSGDGPDKTLYAYYVANNEESVSVQGIKEYLSVNLPDFMVPSYFTRLEMIPRLSSGKLDKKALLKLAESIKEESEFVAPRNNTEKQLAQMWKEMLQIEQVGIKDSFFNIGGDSIKILSLLYSTNTEFNTSLKIEDFYENETIEKMAVLIEQSMEPTLDEDYNETVREIEALKARIMKEIASQKPDNIED